MNVAIKSHSIILVLYAAVFIISLLFLHNNLFLVPAAALVLSIAYICAITGYRFLLLLLVFFLPLSVNLEVEHTGAHILVPSEIFIILVGASYLIRMVFITGRDKVIWKHPVSRLVVMFTLVQLATVFFSSMTMVSVKAMVIKMLYVLVFYFVCVEFFRKEKKNIYILYLVYLVALAGVAVYTLQRHAGFDFTKSYAGTAPEPFFADHTIYGICLVFILPITILLAVKSKEWFDSRILPIGFACTAVLIGVAIFFSTSRAAWLSVLVTIVVAAILYFRVKAHHLILLMIGVSIYALFNLDYIDIAIRSNRYDSKALTADLETQAKSITNITNDNSNAERINRWRSALRMAAEKPLTGFGPGTYQFQYLDFQKPEDMTSISITSPYHIKKGRGGTAHNEFLLVLSESGVIAFALFTLLVLGVIYIASATLKTLANKNEKAILFAVYVGWISYVCHSLFNNFLDTDKAAFLFYSAMAVVVVMDLERREKQVISY